MFKYGSFRNFVSKFFVGIILIAFGSIYLVSLYTYSPNDPGYQNVNGGEIQNILGHFGAYLSSYSLVFIGTLSYLLVFYIILEGGKLFLGINSRFIILKFLSNLSGIILINASIKSVDITLLKTCLFSQFLIDLFTSINLNLLENIFIYFIINFLFLIYFKFLFSVFGLLKYLRFKKRTYEKTLRNEPTIKKRNYVNLSKKNNNPKTNKQLELDNFSFSLPSKNLLSKSNLKNNKNRELEKINTDAAIKLEKTLSEYGVEGKIVGFSSGPIVTFFEFIPNAGIKSSKVIGLSDDIARAMSSISARISTQPGKTSLGIEIPNSKRDNVLFGDLIEEEEFEIENDSLTLAL